MLILSKNVNNDVERDRLSIQQNVNKNNDMN